ncbi:MAG: carbohydrate binding domain-containing protein [Opitutales bacterium]
MKTPSIQSITLPLVASLGIANTWAQTYGAPDFDGDGKADVAYVWEQAGALEMSWHLSDKAKFEDIEYSSEAMSYRQSQRWLYGDFNGDGQSDAAVLRDDAGRATIDVFSLNRAGEIEQSTWAKQLGDFSYASQWFKGDFNGDAKTDIARVFSEEGKRSVFVYYSEGQSFSAPKKWMDQQGEFNADDVWLTGGFDTEPGDDFVVVNAGPTISVDLITSDANVPVYASDEARILSMKWLAEDFDGDGRAELAALWNDSDAVSFDIFVLTDGGLERKSWLSQAFPFVRDHRWFTGDFDGDSRVDIARMWDDSGRVYFEQMLSAGSGLKRKTILRKGIKHRDQNVYTVGDFSGNGKTDILVTWGDGAMRHHELISSGLLGTKAKPLASKEEPFYFSAQSLHEPVMGDRFTRYARIDGAVPVGTDLQSVLDSGNDLLLEKGEIYDTSRTLNYKATYQRIATMDALFFGDYAMIRQNIDQGDYDTLINGNKQSYIHLDSVMVNGNKYVLGQKSVQPGEAQGAMVFFSHCEGVWVKRNILFNARTWSTCHLVESGGSHSHIVEHNYVLGAGDDPRGSGKYVDQNGVGISASTKVGWSDGFSISATKVIARHNFIMDCTDVGMVLFGAPGSHVHDNLILNFSRDNHGGLNFVDDSAHRYIGTDTTFGKELKLYDYRNNIIEDNRIIASGCRIQIGMPMGNRIWKRAGPAVFDFGGGVIRNNILEGDSFGYGFVMDYVKNINFYGNRSIATHSGVGRGTSDNDNSPDPAAAFIYNPESVMVAEGSEIQSEFVPNQKVIEHYLFHNGTPQTGEKYHYYEYTIEEARDMVVASYLEMLGRAPTAEELERDTNAFMVDPKPETIINEAYKMYGDLFKRNLMETEEFVGKFGSVKTHQLQGFRNARWRDRITVFDTESLLETGNYADAKDMYDRVIAALEWQPLDENAEIVSVSELPDSLAQGERVSVAVEVKNTGDLAWMNTPENPKRIGLSTVGEDITLGLARSYLPQGVVVNPGESYVFNMELFPVRIGYAGREEPTSTDFPYNLKMVHESEGYFGETLAEHLGEPYRIAIEHCEEAMPLPSYNATFVEQVLQGEPELNGIRPGAKFAVSLTFKNASTVTSEPWTKANGFTLGSENTKDNRTWGSNRIPLDDWQIAESGETVTFSRVMQAPMESGIYNFQWQMVGAGWFGEMSKNLRIEVTENAPEIGIVDSTFVSVDVPESVKAGETFTLKAKYANSGTQAWGADSPVFLRDAVKVVDQTLQHGTYVTSQHSDSIPQEDASKLFDNQKSTKYLTKNSTAWVKYHFPESGFPVDQYAITNTPEAGPGPEMIDTGSFENGVEGWELRKASITTEDAFSGKASLVIRSMDGKNTGNSTITIPGLKPDTDYVLSFWMRNAPDTQGSFVLDTNDVFDRTCQWVKHGGQPTEWTLFRGVFNTAVVDDDRKQKNPEALTLRLRANQLIGSVFIDDLSLVELGGGGTQADPFAWTLEGSNDGESWIQIDQQSGVVFENRGQRKIFNLPNTQSFSTYKLTVQNRSGESLQFSEFELLMKGSDQLMAQSAWVSTVSTSVEPGQSYTFTQQFLAPETPGTYRIRLGMLAADKGSESFVGDTLPEQLITVE